MNADADGAGAILFTEATDRGALFAAMTFLGAADDVTLEGTT